MEARLVEFVRNGGGLVSYHAANNAFLAWPEYNDMIGLLWRDPAFGQGLAINGGKLTTIPKGQGLAPGHGPRHDFEMELLDANHPITHGLPKSWLHPSEQLTHGQHGPAQGLHVLTYAFSPVSQQGEPMDWIRNYGKGRVYVTMLGHTWKNEQNPNLDDYRFQQFARARHGVGRDRPSDSSREPRLEAFRNRRKAYGMGNAWQLPVDAAA